RVVREISKRELSDADTHGGHTFRSLGYPGVRGEAESGFASLDAGSMSMLRNARGRFDDAVCVNALLSLMAVVDDSTVLHRGGTEALDYVKESAADALAIGGTETAIGRAAIARMADEFVQRRISPGGSADLLSAGLFLSSFEHFLGLGESINIV
ncbi:MAG: triphosphoribosyl-dephospho-CoA synthase, partial [Treponemataceae bacterium]